MRNERKSRALFHVNQTREIKPHLLILKFYILLSNTITFGSLAQYYLRDDTFLFLEKIHKASE